MTTPQPPEEVHNVGYGPSDPATSGINRGYDVAAVSGLKAAAMRYRETGLTEMPSNMRVGFIITLCQWIETVDKLHQLDHSVANTYWGQLEEIDALLFGSKGRSQHERLRRVRQLVATERLLRKTEADLEALREKVVATWHSKDPPPLSECLGMTSAEYIEWVENQEEGQMGERPAVTQEEYVDWLEGGDRE